MQSDGARNLQEQKPIGTFEIRPISKSVEVPNSQLAQELTKALKELKKAQRTPMFKQWRKKHQHRRWENANLAASLTKRF